MIVKATQLMNYTDALPHTACGVGRLNLYDHFIPLGKPTHSIYVLVFCKENTKKHSCIWSD